MKKFSIILIALVCCVSFSELALAEDPVSFADPNLKIAVESALGILDPTPAEMLTLTELNAKNYEPQIINLEGLQYAENLTSLNLYNNQVSDITPLSGLTNLTYLDLYHNQYINDISPLSGLTNLMYLDIGANQIIDISWLSGLTNLNELRLHHNQITDILSTGNAIKPDKADSEKQSGQRYHTAIRAYESHLSGSVHGSAQQSALRHFSIRGPYKS
jgi:hypothetical protein